MLPRGHRAIGALALLMVVLLGILVLAPLVSAQPHQVQGVVSNCQTAGPVSDATVTLTDVNGINRPLTGKTGLGGTYVFRPPSGSYSVAAERSGFYPSEASTPPVRFDGSSTIDMPPICMEPHGNGTAPATLNVTVTGTGGSPVPGATVAAYSPVNPSGRIQLVTTGTTGPTGAVNLTLWDDSFRIRASFRDLQTVEEPIDVVPLLTMTINLVVPVELRGRVRNASSGNFISEGVVAWLYAPGQPDTSAFRQIPATVKESLYEFENVRVTDGTYWLIVDAKGHRATATGINMTGAQTERNINLEPAPWERFETTVLYGAQDWNNLTMWRNLTLNADSTLPGLLPPDLRNLRFQIDSTFGDRDALLDQPEIDAFRASLVDKGPGYVTTDPFFTTNSQAYNCSEASFLVVDLEGLAPGPVTTGPVWINTTWTCTLKQTPPPWIVNGAKTYWLNMTLAPDSNVTNRFDFAYRVDLPDTYQRNGTTSTVSPAGTDAVLTNFTRFIVDPVVGTKLSFVNMTISKALNGTVRAAVVGPPGKFHALNATFSNYSALVAKDTELTFSARDSVDPNGPPEDNNFTWQFGSAGTRWGIEPKIKFTANGTYNVNIVMSEGEGLNLSFRNITIFVDDVLPNAQIKTNLTGEGSANGRTIRVDEGIPVRFDGVLSTDLAFPGRNGTILSTGYAWDFNGDRVIDATSRVVSHAFDKPGTLTVNLTVTDSVGWKSVNATMTAVVNDTTAPVIDFDILDPENDWTTIQSPMERQSIALDASKTTDEHDADSGLTFTWTIPGSIIVDGTTIPGPNVTRSGINVSFAWQEWNLSYSVRLTVHDTGFCGDQCARPNWANFTRNVSVQIDRSLHADLRVFDMKPDTRDPEEGGTLSVSVNVTNKVGWATASAVTAEIIATTGGVRAAAPIDSVRWFRDGSETPSDTTIPAGTTVTLVLTTRLTGQGNKTLQVFVRDATEPYTLLGDNRPQQAVNVRQPWWQPYAVIGAVIGLIVLAVFGMYARRKIKAGEWRPIRGRRGEKAAEEKPRREVKEEKKRL